MFTRTNTGRTQETSPDLFLPDLPHTRPDPPQVRPSFSFGSALHRALTRLAGIHLRISLCRLTLAGGWRAAAELAEAIKDPGLLVGLRDDGSLWVLWAGPRQPGAEGDLLARRTILRKLGGVLGNPSRLNGDAGLRGAIMHCWADELDVSCGSADPFALLPAEPLDQVTLAAA